jgi:DNA-binding winged helix-turn-helix (wHTH) protein
MARPPFPIRRSPTAPLLDNDGVLRFGGGWVSLPPIEARMAATMVDRFGAVVHRDTLAHAGWPQGAPGRNALDVHVLRLRRRLAPLGLSITTVRSRGYLLAPSPSPSPSPASNGGPTGGDPGRGGVATD